MRSLLPLLLLSLLGAQTGAPGVISIPAGGFTMGGGNPPDQLPQRQVTLSAYRIDRSEVSLRDFEGFVAQGYDQPEHWSEAGWAWHLDNPEGAGAQARAQGRPPDHPVVAVSWYEAEAYCSWRGGRLPTEAEWERAARGDNDARRFPWGDEPRDDAAWFVKERRDMLVRDGIVTHAVTDADDALASPWGLIHAAGNVWEWTADSYHREAYRSLPTQDPRNDDATPWRVIRGGSYMNLASYCTTSHREPALPGEPRLSIGIRCAYQP
jgi:formylglycine-generating enzyme required for sulfatase activity